MTRFMVLGSTGFIGGVVLSALRALPGATVLTAGRRAVEGDGHTPMDLGAGSVAEFAGALAAAAPDVLINCAGVTRGELDRLAAVNVIGVSRLAEAMITAVPKARLIHLGSAGEYGRTVEGASVPESAAPHPVGVYGFSKLGGTQALSVARASGLDAVVLRVFNPIGPGTPVGSLPGRLTSLLRAAPSTGGTISVGPLGAYRDFVDVRDVARAVVTVATAAEVPAGLYNIGSGEATLVRRVMEELVAVSGYQGTITEDGAGSARSADVAWQRADITAVGRDLGWRPEIDVVTSVRDGWFAAS